MLFVQFFSEISAERAQPVNDKTFFKEIYISCNSIFTYPDDIAEFRIGDLSTYL